MKFLQIAVVATLMASTEAARLHHRALIEEQASALEEIASNEESKQKAIAETEAFLDDLEKAEFDFGGLVSRGRDALHHLASHF